MSERRSQHGWADTLGAAFVRSRRALQFATGIFLVLLGLSIGKARIAVLADAGRATGRVVSYEARSMPRGSRPGGRSTAWMPVVEFPAGTRVVRFTDWLGSSVRTAGQDGVPVIYRRAEPSLAMIDRPVGNWLPWAPTLALGLFLALDAMRGWLGRRRRVTRVGQGEVTG